MASDRSQDDDLARKQQYARQTAIEWLIRDYGPEFEERYARALEIVVEMWDGHNG